jgi:hypothetical protein
MYKGEKKERRWQPLPFPHVAPKQDQALPGEGEPEGPTAALGCDAGALGMQMRERMGKRGGVWLFNGRGVPVKLVEVVVVSWAMVGRVSGGVAELGLGVGGALSFGWTQVARGGEMGLPFRLVPPMRRCSTMETVS